MAGKDQELRLVVDGVLLTAATVTDGLQRAHLYKVAALLLELAAEVAVDPLAEVVVRRASRLALEDVRAELENAWANGPLPTEVFDAFEAYLEPEPAEAVTP